MKMTFKGFVSDILGDALEVVATASITPGDEGGLHCPPSAPTVEIETVTAVGDEGGTELSESLSDAELSELETYALDVYEKAIADDDGPGENDGPGGPDDFDAEREHEVLDLFDLDNPISSSGDDR